MKNRLIRHLTLPILLILSTGVCKPNVSLLLEESVGGAGEFTGSGHAAIYFSALCAESPSRLRHCKPGEEGAVITTYPELGTKTNYKWIALPLTAFLYAVTSQGDKPLYGMAKSDAICETIIALRTSPILFRQSRTVPHLRGNGPKCWEVRLTEMFMHSLSPRLPSRIRSFWPISKSFQT